VGFSRFAVTVASLAGSFDELYSYYQQLGRYRLLR
jgi:hypothetical protein